MDAKIQAELKKLQESDPSETPKYSGEFSHHICVTQDQLDTVCSIAGAVQRFLPHDGVLAGELFKTLLRIHVENKTRDRQEEIDQLQQSHYAQMSGAYTGQQHMGMGQLSNGLAQQSPRIAELVRSFNGSQV